jgi:hypothetical protein
MPIILNQAVDFIFYNDKNQVYLINYRSEKDSKYMFPGKFFYKGNKKKLAPASIENAKDLLNQLVDNIKIKDIDNLQLYNHGFYIVKAYSTPKKEGVISDIIVLVTQVFSVKISDDAISRGTNKVVDTKWIDMEDDTIFAGSKEILNNEKADFNKTSEDIANFTPPPSTSGEEDSTSLVSGYDYATDREDDEEDSGGSRKRRGKKSKKTKKGRKHSGRKHSGRKHSGRKHSRRRHH